MAHKDKPGKVLQVLDTAIGAGGNVLMARSVIKTTKVMFDSADALNADEDDRSLRKRGQFVRVVSANVTIGPCSSNVQVEAGLRCLT